MAFLAFFLLIVVCLNKSLLILMLCYALIIVTHIVCFIRRSSVNTVCMFVLVYAVFMSDMALFTYNRDVVIFYECRLYFVCITQLLNVLLMSFQNSCNV